jgi:hypothetical protein
LLFYLPFLTAIPINLIISEGHETALNGFEYQFTTGKPLKNLEPTLDYCGNGKTRIEEYTEHAHSYHGTYTHAHSNKHAHMHAWIHTRTHMYEHVIILLRNKE